LQFSSFLSQRIYFSSEVFALASKLSWTRMKPGGL
jgi:hypothetical protein